MAMNKKEKSEIGELRTELRDSVGELRRHMGVLVESVRSDVKIIAEQHGSIVTKLEEHDRRFDIIDIDLKAIKGALFGMSHKLDNHEVRICKLESGK